jgi:AcrR family transcriptional regulator
MGTSRPPRRRPRVSPSAKERIDITAYELFSRHGVRAVGVDTLAASAGVAKMTLYKYYPSKDELALAFLRRREEVWTRSWLEQEVQRRGETPAEKLLAIFDVFDLWFRRSDFEACAFARVLLEHDERHHPVRRAAVRHLNNIGSFVGRLARDAGVPDADEFARLWQTLMMGSIVLAYAGDLEAARRAKGAARLALARYGLDPK